MDAATEKLVADLTKERDALKEQLAEERAVNTVLTGELIKKRMDPDYLV